MGASAAVSAGTPARHQRIGRAGGTADVRCEDEAAIIQALAWSREGLDLADAMHVASSRTASRFATSDQTLIKQAD